MSYAFKATMINEFKANDYDSNYCINYHNNGNCKKYQRFGDFVLTQRGDDNYASFTTAVRSLLIFTHTKICIFA